MMTEKMATDIPDKSFDVVACIDVLEHVQEGSSVANVRVVTDKKSPALVETRFITRPYWCG